MKMENELEGRREYLVARRSVDAVNRYTDLRREAILSGNHERTIFYGERRNEHLEVLKGLGNNISDSEKEELGRDLYRFVETEVTTFGDFFSIIVKNLRKAI